MPRSIRQLHHPDSSEEAATFSNFILIVLFGLFGRYAYCSFFFPFFSFAMVHELTPNLGNHWDALYLAHAPSPADNTESGSDAERTRGREPDTTRRVFDARSAGLSVSCGRKKYLSNAAGEK